MTQPTGLPCPGGRGRRRGDPDWSGSWAQQAKRVRGLVAELKDLVRVRRRGGYGQTAARFVGERG